jgi:hypothetical protein
MYAGSTSVKGQKTSMKQIFGQKGRFPFCIFEHHRGITTFVLPAQTLTSLAPTLTKIL